MKVTVENSVKIAEFPRLMQYRDDKSIILVTMIAGDRAIGTLLQPAVTSPFKTGHTFIDWSINDLKDFHGTITLSN